MNEEGYSAIFYFMLIIGGIGFLIVAATTVGGV
jgi:hypothetical protein